MPVKPQAVRYRCRKCGWNKVFAPTSDALLEAPPSECEKCGSDDLKKSAAALQTALTGLLAALGKK